MTTEDSLWICRSIFAKSHVGGPLSCAEIVSELQQLVAAGVAQVTREGALSVLSSLIRKTQLQESHNPYMEAYRALMELYRDGMLEFDLEEAVETMIDSLRDINTDRAMEALLECVDTGA